MFYFIQEHFAYRACDIDIYLIIRGSLLGDFMLIDELIAKEIAFHQTNNYSRQLENLRLYINNWLDIYDYKVKEAYLCFGGLYDEGIDLKLYLITNQV